MASIIIYLENLDGYIDRTIDDIIDKTPQSILNEIIICNDTGSDFERSDVCIITSNRIGKSKAWNIAAKQATSSHLIFLRQTTKVSIGWLYPLIKRLESDSESIISPTIHSLDTNLWSMGSDSIERFGWRWDLKLYNRPVKSEFSPGISSLALAVDKDHLFDIGGFDEYMDSGDGEALELSIRNWFFGGTARVISNSTIAVATSTEDNINNLARIINIWFPSFSTYFYAIRSIKPSNINTGRLNNLIGLRHKQVITAELFLNTQLPELLNIYKLYKSCSGKSVAVVSNGPSIDLVDQTLINSYDVIIGIDYIGYLFECDYVITHDMKIVTDLYEKYNDNQLIIPFFSDDIFSNCLRFELGDQNVPQQSVFPPFSNFGNPVHSAIHFALFANAESIMLFGCDNKIIDGKSHSTKIEHYGDGKLLVNSESTKQLFATWEYGLDCLSKLANKTNTTLLRVNCV